MMAAPMLAAIVALVLVTIRIIWREGVTRGESGGNG